VWGWGPMGCDRTSASCLHVSWYASYEVAATRAALEKRCARWLSERDAGSTGERKASCLQPACVVRLGAACWQAIRDEGEGEGAG
jgi:hypothetical protein